MLRFFRRNLFIVMTFNLTYGCYLYAGDRKNIQQKENSALVDSSSDPGGYGLTLCLGPQIQGYVLGFETSKFATEKVHFGLKLFRGSLNGNQNLTNEYVKASFVGATALSRWFFLGSTNAFIGAVYQQMKGSYYKPSSFGSRSQSGETSTEGTIARNFRANIWQAQVGVGSQWFWESGTTLGVDWVGLNYILSNKLSLEGDSYDKSGNELTSRSEKEIESAVKFLALNIRAGFHF